jgi:Uma2 family endonuclease
MSLAMKNEESCYTYADVLEWDESVRAEIIDGEVYMMAPPARRHQQISMQLSLQLGNFLDGKPCKVYAAPFGVRLFPRADLSDDTYVEPDIVVVCDASKLDERGCNGAPDLVIEILSASTTRHDLIVKLQKYREAGVREYWVVDPESSSLTAYILDNGRYYINVYDKNAEVPISVLPGCLIRLEKVFAE